MLQKDPAHQENDEPSALAKAPASLREWLSLRDGWVALAVLLVALESAAHAIAAMIRGGSIGRDIDAIAGHPRGVTEDDWTVVAGFGFALFLGTLLASRVVFDGYARKVAGFACFAAATAVVAEVAGVAALAVDRTDAAQVAAVITICAALPATVVAATGMWLTAVRLASFAVRARQGMAIDPTSAPDGPPPSPSAPGQRARWRRGYDCGRGPDLMPLEVAIDERTGIGLSGGGIRAASVMLGALQDPTFRENVLLRARFLVSVSGGGYTAGAYQQALTDAGPVPDEAVRVLRDPRLAFVEGSAEEDHIRRNASYLARNPLEMLVALGLLARHLLLNLLLLFGPAVALGVLAGCFINRVPITPLDGSVGDWPHREPVPPTVSSASWIALATVAVLVLLSWLGAQGAAARCGPSRWGTWALLLRRGLTWTTPAIGTVFWAIAAFAVGIPMAIWGAAWVLHLGADSIVAVGSSIVTVLLTYAASLAALLWRNRKNLKKDTPQIPQAVPRGVAQILLMILALASLALSWLLLFGGAATTVIGADDRSDLIGVAILLTVVGLLGGVVDETTLSLHPFYRRRLAKAFAVRVIERRDRTVAAEPYDSTERTTLSAYGKVAPVVARQFPEVVFAASATVGDGRTPAGSNRVSFTFSSEFIGGPDIGYVPTSKLERRLSPRLKRDLTVQGAVALSGAALAASIGAQSSKWYETLFAITGVRLGAWMPNPEFLTGQERRGGRRWHEPGLPRVRRMSYLLRELFGVHPAAAPLVQVTDGGFYDNLGLIELFRRRCTTIYCIDASGDNPPPAATLAQVVSLAYQELGVQVDLADSPFATTPGSGTPPGARATLTSLASRLSETGVITADFTYPEESGLPAQARRGTLVVAKASLWPNLPYELQAYAMRNPVFPHDSTADQWFDDGQYGAYTALGRELGAASVIAMQSRVAAQEAGTPAG